jgi:hypothetical protein
MEIILIYLILRIKINFIFLDLLILGFPSILLLSINRIILSISKVFIISNPNPMSYISTLSIIDKETDLILKSLNHRWRILIYLSMIYS